MPPPAPEVGHEVKLINFAARSGQPVALNLQRFAYNNSFEEAFPDGIRGFNRPTNVRFGPDGCTMSPIMVRFAILGAPTPMPVDFTITLDPNVSAFWGDANRDGKAGLSDIFSTITLSADHRTITYSDGLIPSTAGSPTSSSR
jgi:hypothetical protein